jgi:WD40 repeat protein
VTVWDSRTGDRVREIATASDDVLDVAWSPIGNDLVVASFDGAVAVWDAGSGEEVAHLIDADGDVRHVAWSPDGQWVAAAGPSGATVWETRGWQEASVLADVRGPAVAWSPDSSLLALPADVSTVRVIDVETGNGTAIHEAPDLDSITELAWSWDGRRLALGDRRGDVQLWDLSQDSATGLKDHVGGAASLSWSPMGDVLATGGNDATVRLWDATTGQQLGEPLKGHQGIISSLTWSPTGAHLLSVGDIPDESALLWRAQTEAESCADALAALGPVELRSLTTGDERVPVCARPDQAVRLPPLPVISVAPYG